jgi:hypothetical protein
MVKGSLAPSVRATRGNRDCVVPRGRASLSGVYHMLLAQVRRMPFWEQPTPALADWEEPQANAISLN